MDDKNLSALDILFAVDDMRFGKEIIDVFCRHASAQSHGKDQEHLDAIAHCEFDIAMHRLTAIKHAARLRYERETMK